MGCLCVAVADYVGVQILSNSLEYIKGELNLTEMVIAKWLPPHEVLSPPSTYTPLTSIFCPSPQTCIKARALLHSHTHIKNVLQKL